MIAKSPSKRIRTSSATSPLIVTGFATSLRYSALSSSEPSGVETMKSSAKLSARRFTSPFFTDATKSRFRAVSVSRSRFSFAFVCMAISSGVRGFLVQLRNEALIFDPQEFNTDRLGLVRRELHEADPRHHDHQAIASQFAAERLQAGTHRTLPVGASIRARRNAGSRRAALRRRSPPRAPAAPR